MDENADLRLTIETARKSTNWARRCYAYELAMEYFSILEPDCYELCSYCDLIPEFLEEKNECCLTRALGAVKVFVKKCVDAPLSASAIIRIIIEQFFFSASNRVREIATDIILDFIECEACNIVLKELIAGALKYDGVRSDECIRVMRYALLDFGPRVISICKLIDFIAILVRTRSFSRIDDECSQLLILIYKCLGPQARVHLIHILDPDYLLAIERSYQEMGDIPVYHCRFVRFSRECPLSLIESDEEVFATCRIAEPTSHPTNNGSEEAATDGEGMVSEADESPPRGLGREAYFGAGDVGHLVGENMCLWDAYRLNNIANYLIDFGDEGNNQYQMNRARPNAYDNAIAYDVLNHFNRVDSLADLFRPLPDIFPERNQLVPRWNLNNVEELNDHPNPVSWVDRASQTDEYSTLATNPFEVLINKLMDKYGAEDILNGLWLKLNAEPKVPETDEGTKELRRNHVSRDCKSSEAFSRSKDQSQNIIRGSFSSVSVRPCFPDNISIYNNLHNSNDDETSSFNPKSAISTHGEEKSVLSVEKNTTRSLRVLEEENAMKEPALPFERMVLSEDCHRTKNKETFSGLVKTKSQLHSTKGSLLRTFFRKISFLSSKSKKTTGIILEGQKNFSKKFRFVFKGKRNYRSYLNALLKNNKETNYFHQNLPSESSCSYFDERTNNCSNCNRSRIFPMQRTIFSDMRQISSNQNQIPAGFPSNPEEQWREVCRFEDIPSSSYVAEENVDDGVMYLSESDSISEISPNLCCYCFQKNSIRRLDSKKCGEKKQNKPEEGNVSGWTIEKAELRRRNGNTSSSSPAEGNFLMSLHHRGSGDEPSQSALNSQEIREEPAREERGTVVEQSKNYFSLYL